MWSKLLIIVLSAVLTYSCSEEQEYAPPVFPEEVELQSIPVAEDIILSFPYDMCMDQDYVYVLSMVDDTWLQVYDKQSGEYKGGYIPRGQGPGELTTGFNLFYDESKRTISIFDTGSMKLLSFQIQEEPGKLLSLIEEKPFYDRAAVVRRLWHLPSGQELVDGQLGEGQKRQKRFQLLSGNKLISEYNVFPIESPEEHMAYIDPQVAISPDGKKMAAGIFYGAVLETFTLADSVRLTSLRKFYPSHILYEGGAIKETDKTVYGFISLSGTDKRLYSVFVGDKDPNQLNHIAVFDWNGCEVIKYRTDCSVVRLCISYDDKTLYAVAHSIDKGFYLVSFNL